MDTLCSSSTDIMKRNDIFGGKKIQRFLLYLRKIYLLALQPSWCLFAASYWGAVVLTMWPATQLGSFLSFKRGLSLVQSWWSYFCLHVFRVALRFCHRKKTWLNLSSFSLQSVPIGQVKLPSGWKPIPTNSRFWWIRHISDFDYQPTGCLGRLKIAHFLLLTGGFREAGGRQVWLFTH